MATSNLEHLARVFLLDKIEFLYCFKTAISMQLSILVSLDCSWHILKTV